MASVTQHVQVKLTMQSAVGLRHFIEAVDHLVEAERDLPWNTDVQLALEHLLKAQQLLTTEVVK